MDDPPDQVGDQVASLIILLSSACNSQPGIYSGECFTVDADAHISLLDWTFPGLLC